VLPPGELNGIIQVQLDIYHESFMTPLQQFSWTVATAANLTNKFDGNEKVDAAIAGRGNDGSMIDSRHSTISHTHVRNCHTATAKQNPTTD